MLIVHLGSGLLIAIAAALWGSAAGYPLWACLGLYILGGNVGVVASAMIEVLRLRDSKGPR